MQFCKCGCGARIIGKSWHKYYGIPTYLPGHNGRGEPLSLEHRRKISESSKGKNTWAKGSRLSEEAREKRKKLMEGRKGPMYGNRHTEEAKLKMSQALKGKTPWMKGRKHTEETIKKIREKRALQGATTKGRRWTDEQRLKFSRSRKGEKRKPFSEEHKRKMGLTKIGNKYSLGHKHTDETKKKISMARMGHPVSLETRLKLSKSHAGLRCGEKHHNWRGGISSEEYGFQFNNELREAIRRRDNFTCQGGCGNTEEQLRDMPDVMHRVLDVHHIDYNKQNNDPFNLILLCKSCHMKTNYERKYWTEYYQNLQSAKLTEVYV